MKQIILLLLTISHGGHWLGGRTGSVTVAWPVESGPQASKLEWACRLGSIPLAQGTADMVDGTRPVTIRFAPPKVRVRTTLRFECRIKSANADAPSAAAESDLYIYPEPDQGELAQKYAGKRVVVMGCGGGLSTLLDREKIPFHLAPDLSHVGLIGPDMLIIGPDACDPGPLGQADAECLLKAGTRVIALRQTRTPSILGPPGHSTPELRPDAMEL